MFATFDERTQDSGNVSYSVEVDGRRYFVKTAGLPEASQPYFDHTERVASLRNATRLAESASHHTLPKLGQVIESPTGPMLVYDWVAGDLVRGCLARLRGLSPNEIGALLTEIYDLHRELTCLGWIGGLLRRRDDLRLRPVPRPRHRPRRTHELGATIDERTTVFTMGRTAAVLMSDGSLDREPFLGTDRQLDVMLRACEEDPNDRFQSVAELYAAWMDAERQLIQKE